MGTRHWPEDANEAVEKLEAEIARLKKVFWSPEEGGSEVERLRSIILDLDNRHQEALRQRNSLDREVKFLKMQAVEGCEYIGQIEKLQGQLKDSEEISEAWKRAALFCNESGEENYIARTYIELINYARKLEE